MPPKREIGVVPPKREIGVVPPKCEIGVNSPTLQPTPQEWVIKDTFLLLQSIELGAAYAPKHSEKPIPHFPMTSRLQNGKSLDFTQTYSTPVQLREAFKILFSQIQ